MKKIILILLLYLISLGTVFANKLDNAYSHCKIEEYSKCAELYWQLVNEQNDPFAANNLGSLYLDGKGVPKDAFTAVELFKKAIFFGLNDLVEKEYRGAPETSLGYIYLTGEYPGIDRDHKKALFWTLKATNYGHTNAYSNLALIYATGFGVEKDYVIAITNLIKSVEAFDKKFNWIINDEDEWNDFLLDGSKEIWVARSLYWKAIKTGDPDYLEELEVLKEKLKLQEIQN